MSERHSTWSTWVQIQVILFASILIQGCARHLYDAHSLPSQYVARPAFDAANVDISMLSKKQHNSQQIFPGDTLRMVVITGADNGRPEEWPVQVMDDGSVQLPMVGKLVVSGRTVQSAQDLIRNASIERGVYHNPSIALTIESRRTNRVSVVGAVQEPGDYELPASQNDLLSAILAAGGLSEDADQYIDIRRASPPVPATSVPDVEGSYFAHASHQQGETQPAQPHSIAAPDRVTRIDLVSAAQLTQPSPVSIGDGDIITVHKRPKRYIHVMGLVNKPDRFELKGSEAARVLDAIAIAGGVKLSIADRVLVIRQVSGNQQPVTIQVSLRDAKQNASSNIMLADGDVVSVEETPTTFAMGTIQNLVRFGVNGFF